MKALLALVLAIGSFSVSAEQIDLNEKNIYLGDLAQSGRSTALQTVRFVRTENTPSVVSLKFRFKNEETVCLRTILRREPPRRTCHVDRRGRTFCRTIPGRVYETCVEWGQRFLADTKKLKLNFKKAAELTAGQKEVFEVEFDQRYIRDNKFDYRASFLRSDNAYDVEFTTFLRADTLKFNLK